MYDGSYWVAISSDKQGVSNKPSVITVGSSTTTRYCDFKCTGTNDQTVIQNAINTLTAGGKIILLEGTYNFSNGITHKNDVVIEGQGKGITIINETFPQMISKMSNTSATLAIKNMSINFAVKAVQDRIPALLTIIHLWSLIIVQLHMQINYTAEIHCLKTAM